MKLHQLAILSLLCVSLCDAAPPAFRATSLPEGWTLVKGEIDPGAVRSAKPAGALDLKTTEAVSLPIDMTFRFRMALGDGVTFQASEDMKDAKPLLRCNLRLNATNQVMILAHSSGEPMATTAISTRTYSIRDKGTGQLSYLWRFPKVKNLWDEADRKEIGAAFAKLVPFEEKTFALRMVLTDKTRQIWLDDRLVAEAKAANPSNAIVSIQLAKTAQMLSADFAKPLDAGRFLPLSLGHYSHARAAQAVKAETELTSLRDVPMLLPKTSQPDINLGDSLYRYRRTNGSGPEASYVNATHVWPGSFKVDPATLAFKVPYRNYQNAWLLAWVDNTPNSVAKGAFRFFRPDAGYPAPTDFEISEEAISNGLVTKLPQQTADGKQLYLVKVPIDTANLYGFRDMANDFLEFELTKPLSLGRSYPDPIYYGYHPAGPSSSIHVVGITLEQAPFDYEVIPKQFGFVFEQPEQPAYAVAVTNTSDKPLTAKVTLQSKSYNGEERQTVSQNVTVPAGETKNAELVFKLKHLGWHELETTVEAGDVERHNTLSMVLLPPNTRTYGDAANEIRFGTWDLLGHYTPLKAGDSEVNEQVAAMYRKLGLRRTSIAKGRFITPELGKKYDFLPTGPHTIIRVVYQWRKADDAAKQKIIDVELEAAKQLCEQAAAPTYFYGGEWHLGRMVQYAPWPIYTGDGDRELTAEERDNAEHQIKVFTTIGKAIHEKYPQVKRILQWGAPLGTIAYLRSGIDKSVVDAFGMDAPMFELMPEISNVTGCINSLWGLRAEAKRLGWPKLPIHWCEGPFFPTNPGALTMADQMNYQIRYMLLGLSYGIDGFESAVVPFDAGNYYGAEHYGAGVFHRLPLMNPKPAVAAIATMTSTLCGADPTGGIETGDLCTYCMGFERAKDKAKIFALWRVRGTTSATIKTTAKQATVTDSMGNSTVGSPGTELEFAL